MEPCGGLRNLIYESHCFGSTFTWDPTTLQIESHSDTCGDPETVELVGISGDGRVIVKFFEDRDATEMAGPDTAQISGQAILGDTQQTQPASFDPIQFSFPEVGGAGPHVVEVSFEGDPDSPEAKAWEEVAESVRAPTPNWNMCHPAGVIEVLGFVPTIDGTNVSVELTLTNIDNKPAKFEFARVLLTTKVNADDPGDSGEFPPNDITRVVTIPRIPLIKARVKVVLEFENVDANKVYEVVYDQGVEPVTLGSFFGDVIGPGRPRINPGG